MRRVFTARATFCAALMHARASSPPSSVSLVFDRALRHLLQPYRKTLSLTLSRDTPPLRALHAALRTQGLPEAHADNLILLHGKRRIISDADLAEVLRRTAEVGVEPLLRVTPVDAESLPEPPPARPSADDAPVHADLRLVSFFRFARLDASARAALAPEIHALLERLRARGSVYLAPEGINGQLSVPVDALDALRAELPRLDGLSGLRLNEQHESLGTVAAGEPTAPYRKLLVREKDQILTDGLGEDGERLEWNRAGTELEAADWHSMMVSGAPPTGSLPAEEAPLLLDCRNEYESSVGSFVGAEPLGTEVFSESWSVLRERLRDVPRSRPIMTFCTGGIRCVKTNAFLEQELGFTSTYRLRDGIHGYLRHVSEHPDDGENSQWRGDNFVFYSRSADEGASDADETDRD